MPTIPNIVSYPVLELVVVYSTCTSTYFVLRTCVCTCTYFCNERYLLTFKKSGSLQNRTTNQLLYVCTLCGAGVAFPTANQVSQVGTYSTWISTYLRTYVLLYLPIDLLNGPRCRSGSKPKWMVLHLSFSLSLKSICVLYIHANVPNT